MSIKALSDYTIYAKYAHYLPEKKRRESWKEQVNRMFDMHARRFAIQMEEDEEFRIDFEFAKEQVLKKRVLGSQRALQNGGEVIQKHEAKIYNCAYHYIDRTSAFPETMYLLLCGVGVGFSVQKHHVSKLPDISKRTKGKKYHCIDDSIEGWSNAIGILVSSYFTTSTRFSEYVGYEIDFDYSLIRPSGSLIANKFKAPGPDGLRNSINKIRQLFESRLKNNKDGEFAGKLRPIDVYDIVMHMSDAVLSGGVRRSATISLFSMDDDEMMTAKTGNWFLENPQRGRSNNSVMLVRDKVSREQFHEIMKSTKEFGEPGFIWSDSTELGFNPCVEICLYPQTEDGRSGVSFCVAGDTKLITRDKIGKIKDLVGKSIDIWNGQEWTEVTPFKTGESKTLYRVNFGDGSYLDVTDNHRFLAKNRFDKEFKEYTTLELQEELITGKYTLSVPRANINADFGGYSEEFAYEYGYVLGDGTVNTRGYPITSLYSEHDYNLNMRGRLNERIKTNSYGTEYQNFTFDTLDIKFSKKLKYDNGLPEEIFSWDKGSILQFIAGWIDADGSTSSNGIRLYGREDKLRDAQLLLTKCGVDSSINLMSRKREMTNLGRRKNDVWYLQITKTIDIPAKKIIKPNDSCSRFKGKYQTIRNIVKLTGLHDSFCVTEPKLHQCVFNNVLTKQCNLTEINGKWCISEENFLQACRASAIIGTMQAAYTNFNYLSIESKEIADREALLGCSITGMMDNPDILFNEELQKKGAEEIKRVNRKIASKIGVNPSARTTCIKPAGCLVPETNIITEHGLIELEECGDISQDGWSNHNLHVATDEGFMKSDKFFVNGYGPTTILNLDSGLFLESTPNHKYRVIEDGEYVWKSADDICEGDLLVYGLNNYPQSVQYQRLVCPKIEWDKRTHRRKKVMIPEILDESIAFFLGMYYGDGSNHARSVRIHGSSKRKGFDRLLEIISDKFGINAIENEDNREGDRVFLSVNSKEFVEFLKENKIFKEKSNEIKVPLLIRTSPRSVVESFLDGFNTADGNCGNNSGKTYCTTSYSFAEKILLLLRALGKESKIYFTPATDSSKGKNMRYVVQELKGKSGKVDKIRTYHREFYHILAKLGLNEFSVDMVVGKSESANLTCDISVPSNNTYIANSYVTHNTTSCVLGTASGIHPHHAKRYIRRVQANKNEFPAQHFQKINPIAVEESVWSTNKTDLILSFCCEVPIGSIVKNQIGAIELLERVKTTQQNWVKYGTNEEFCVFKGSMHNVSNTITIKEEEWSDVEEYIYNNRKWFAGISLLSYSGDKDYPQAPFTTILTHNEITREYGEGSVLASGLAVDGIHAFGNLWKACDCVLGIGENIDPITKEEAEMLKSFHALVTNLEVLKRDWVRRALQFSERYFDGDVRRMTYCLKDCANWKLWLDLNREYKQIDWTQVHENDAHYSDSANQAGAACAGGKCELF